MGCVKEAAKERFWFQCVAFLQYAAFAASVSAFKPHRLQAMKEHGPVDLGDVDHALQQFIHETRQHGDLVPPIVRVSNTSHLVANHLTLFLELSSAQKLCVRTRGGLVPLSDFLRQHGYLKHAQPQAVHKAAPSLHPAHTPKAAPKSLGSRN